VSTNCNLIRLQLVTFDPMLLQRFFILFILATGTHHGLFAQNNRLNTHESIGWYNYFGTLKLSEKFSLHTEYQWRRAGVITQWQQGLLRLGVNYHVNPRVLLRVGYGHIETYAYGDIPLNALGRSFTEHRIFQMVQLSHREGKIDLSHRFMLEQRFVGRYSSANLTREDEFPLLHRIRYMVRLQLPLRGTQVQPKVPYVALYDEVFVGFGKNVNANVFDQNRLGVLLGYGFTKTVRVEAGYLNQVLQFGRQLNGRNVFQNNHGLIVNANFAFDLRKKGN
jgi:hypothetical protein